MSIEIEDNSGNQVRIPDPDRFYDHILQFHSRGKSIHDENGHYFTVDDSFRKRLEGLMQSFKQNCIPPPNPTDIAAGFSMIQNALQTPELAYTAIGIGFSVCLLFALLVFVQSRRSRKNPPQSQKPNPSDTEN